MQKPIEIKRAVNFLWIAIAVGFLKPLINWQYFQQTIAQASLGFILTVIVLTLAIQIFLIYKISIGRNWARILFLILTLIGMVIFVPTVLAEVDLSLLSAVISVVQAGLQITALWIMFTSPGKLWFKPPQQPVAE
ncbi:MAG: hypothetical protein ACAH12_07580 [Methylophilaceae bacterium]